MYTNTGSVARFGTAAISEASAIEILVPGFVSQFDGFERVFRYPNQAGVHIESYFNEGITDSTHDCRLAVLILAPLCFETNSVHKLKTSLSDNFFKMKIVLQGFF